jgi:hypothetical protein
MRSGTQASSPYHRHIDLHTRQSSPVVDKYESRGCSMLRMTYVQPPFAASGYRGCPDSVLGRQRRVEYALMGRGSIRCTYAGTSVGELLLCQWLSGMSGISGIRPGIERLTSGSLKLRRWVTPRLSKLAESPANPLALPVPQAIGTKFSLSSGVIGYEFQSYVLAAFVSSDSTVVRVGSPSNHTATQSLGQPGSTPLCHRR